MPLQARDTPIVHFPGIDVQIKITSKIARSVELTSQTIYRRFDLK
jgi:hypothetical protein